MPEKNQVVVAGHICLDIIPDLSKGSVSGSNFFRAGKLAEIGPATLSTGGPVSNTGLAIILLGIPTALMGKVGDDQFGALVKMLLKKRDADQGMITVPQDTTSYTIALSPPGFDRMFLHDAAANNTFCAADVRYDVVEKAGLFHFGYPPLMRRMFENEGKELVEMFRKVKEMGVTTSLDMSIPDRNSASGKANWRKILEKLLPFVDIYLPSAEETLVMLEPDNFDKYAAKGGNILDLFTGEDMTRLSSTLLSFGGKIIGIKCAERGFFLRTATEDRIKNIGRAKPGKTSEWNDRELWEPSFHVDNYATATGSGDSSIAGFLSAYLRGLSPEQCLRYACAVGGFNVTAPDALSGLKNWDDTTAAIKGGWVKNPLEIKDNGWKRDDTKLWHGGNDAKKG
jgi:sugar/nucleoside kinase (ribokinase family)